MEDGSLSTTKYYELVFSYTNISDFSDQNDYGSGADAGILGDYNGYIELDFNISNSLNYVVNGWTHGTLDRYDTYRFYLPATYGFDVNLSNPNGTYMGMYGDNCESKEELTSS